MIAEDNSLKCETGSPVAAWPEVYLLVEVGSLAEQKEISAAHYLLIDDILTCYFHMDFN